MLFKAYNDLIPDLPELGWLSKHSDASRALYDLFLDMQRVLEEFIDDYQLAFYFNSPVIQEAILDLQLAFLRENVHTAEDAVAFIPNLLHSHPALKGLRLKVTQYKACVYSLNVQRLRRPVKTHKAVKAA